MPKKSVLNAGSPVYASSFIDDVTFVVGGGGGQGAHGIKNKVVVYKVSPIPKEVSTFELPQGSDSVTSLAADSSGSIAVGVNIPEENRTGRLLQLSVAKDGTVAKSTQLLDSTTDDISIYQRRIAANGEVIAVANSSKPATVYISTKGGQSRKFDEIRVECEVQDLAVMDDAFTISTKEENGKLTSSKAKDKNDDNSGILAVMCESQIYFHLLNSPFQSICALKAAENHKWGHITYMGKGLFSASSVYGNRQSSWVTIFEVNLNKKNIIDVKRTFKLANFTGVTALSSSGFVLAAANANGDVVVYNSFTMHQMKIFKNLHKLPVTSLSLSKNRETLVSTSMDGSVIVLTDLHGFTSTFSLVMFLLAVLVFVAAVTMFVIHDANGSFQATPTEMPIDNKVPEMKPTSEHPKFVVADLHAMHGMGHGPVVHSFEQPHIELREATKEETASSHTTTADWTSELPTTSAFSIQTVPVDPVNFNTDNIDELNSGVSEANSVTGEHLSTIESMPPNNQQQAEYNDVTSDKNNDQLSKEHDYSITNSAPKTIDESVDDPVSESVADPVMQIAVEPSEEPATAEPVAEPVAEPAAAEPAAAEPVSDAILESLNDVKTEGQPNPADTVQEVHDHHYEPSADIQETPIVTEALHHDEL